MVTHKYIPQIYGYMLMICQYSGLSIPNTIKRYFYAHEIFMQICQNGPLDKFMQFLFMHSSALCIIMYGTIKIYATCT